MNWISRLALVSIVTALLLLIEAGLDPHTADACGCLSPPIPVNTDEYAVNQQAEQIIFEVESDHVVAHVLIQYAGNPESFAWLVPVPDVPELSLSSTAAFGLLERATRPSVSIDVRDMCPDPEFYCTWHTAPQNCESPWGDAVDGGVPFVDAGASPPPAPPVEVIDRQTIGAYDTVVFAAGDAQAAIDWLNQEGFIVNATMAPYMQPYADAGMLFVASKLIPGADVSEIRPLRMRYPGQEPMIPLRLTAVAADPHMTITAYIYGDTFYQPQGHPLVELDESLLSQDPARRNNYPMLLARAIDAAGGDGFVAEYMDVPALPDFDQGTGCCTSDWDQCGIEWDGQCSCPGNPYDAFDCAAETEIIEGLTLLQELAQNHQKLVRLTTRMSAEDMTFDPVFEAMPANTVGFGRLALRGQTMRLDSCRDDILEPNRYQSILERQACASMYCGTGTCATTDLGPACVCEAGSVARVFTDLDGEPSVTCVPDQAPVDLSAGGLVLPDACFGVSCGLGTCLDVGGFATCQCQPGAAGALGQGSSVATCRSVEQMTTTAGAEDFSQEVADVRVCAPLPASNCGQFGWLVQNEQAGIHGEMCASSAPDPALLQPPRAPTCEDYGLLTPAKSGCGCATDGRDLGGAGWLLAMAMAVLLSWRRRSRRA